MTPAYSSANSLPPAERLRRAQDAATPPADLHALARAPNSRAVKEAVARNPNTPPADLLHLAGRYWAAFLDNPVLPLLLLEDPGLLHRLPRRVLQGLVRREDVPSFLLQTLARHPDREVREGARYHVAAENPAEEVETLQQALHRLPARLGGLPELLELNLVPDWLLDAVAGTANSRLRQALLQASQRETAVPYLRDVGQLLRRAAGEWGSYWKHYSFTSKEYRSRTGQGPLQAEEATRLAGGGVAWQRLAVRSPSLPAEQVARLARSSSRVVRAGCAGHRHLPAATAAALLAAGEPAVRQRLAGNRAVPAHLLATLARLPDPLVRRRVARNPSTDLATLRQLAADPDPDVRRAVAGNRHTTAELLDQLLLDDDDDIRTRVGLHAHCTAAHYEQLLADPSVQVRWQVARRPGLPAVFIRRLLDDASEKVRIAAGWNAGTPQHILDFVRAHHDDPPAERPPLPEWGTGPGWAQSQRRAWRSAAPDDAPSATPNNAPDATPNNAPDEASGSVPNDAPRNAADDAQLMNRVRDLDGSGTTDEEMRAWAQSPIAELRQWVSTRTRLPDVQARLAADPERDVRYWLAQSRHLPADLLTQLAADPSGRVREVVGHHENTPPPVLAALAADPQSRVRQSAAANARTPPASLAQLAQEADARTRSGAAANPGTPLETLRQLAADPDSTVQQAVLGNPGLPADVLAARYEGASLGTRRKLAKNPNTPTDLLVRLALEPDSDTREGVAGNPGTPLATLQALWDSRSDVWAELYVLGWRLGENPNTSVDLLLALAADPVTSKADGLMKYPHLTRELFARMVAVAPTADVKCCYLYSMKIPPFVVEVLQADGTVEVLKALASSHHATERVLLAMARQPVFDEQGRDQTTLHLARSPAATSAVLQAILDQRAEADQREGFPWWYRHLVEHRRLTTELLTQLVARLATRAGQPATHGQQHYDQVWLAAVNSPQLNPALLAHFADHPHLEVRAAVLRRADCPPAVRQQMRTAAVQRTLGTATSALDRASALAAPDASADQLRLFYPKAGWVERLAMLHNPHLPADLLAALTQDAHRLVRAAAQARATTGQVPSLAPASEAAA